MGGTGFEPGGLGTIGLIVGGGRASWAGRCWEILRSTGKYSGVLGNAHVSSPKLK